MLTSELPYSPPLRLLQTQAQLQEQARITWEAPARTMTERSNVASPPQLHFDDGSRAMMVEEAAAAVSSGHGNDVRTSGRGTASITDFYEIDRVAADLVGHAPQDRAFRVALQFPDEFLMDSPEVCWLLDEALAQKLDVPPLVFCLGDTTVASCCPDEVAALHLQADILVHYGHACLSPTSGMPIVYSFGFSSIDVDRAATRIVDKIKEESIGCKRMLLLYDVGYLHAMASLESSLAGRLDLSVASARIPTTKGDGSARLPQRVSTSCCGSQQSQTCEDSDGNTAGNTSGNASGNALTCCKTTATATATRTTVTAETEKMPLPSDEKQTEEETEQALPVFGGLELPPSINADDLSDCVVLFVGDQGTSTRQYTNAMLRFLSLERPPNHYLTYSPKASTIETSLPMYLQRQLKRRFYLSQRARDAHVFGIVVSTLSQRHVIRVVESLRRKIEDAGKASYSFAVGKINPAKLANFGEIECFVLVACGEHSLLDEEREYHVPVITPLELEIALGNLDWGGQAYSLDCHDVLGLSSDAAVDADVAIEKQQDAAQGDDEGSDASDGDAPYFSLVTGRYVQPNNAVLRQQNESLDLKHLPGQGKVIEYKSEAAEFLKQREYQGLQSMIGETEVKAATLGQSGIASNYDGV